MQPACGLFSFEVSKLPPWKWIRSSGFVVLSVLSVSSSLGKVMISGLTGSGNNPGTTKAFKDNVDRAAKRARLTEKWVGLDFAHYIQDESKDEQVSLCCLLRALKQEPGSRRWLVLEMNSGKGSASASEGDQLSITETVGTQSPCFWPGRYDLARVISDSFSLATVPGWTRCPPLLW